MIQASETINRRSIEAAVLGSMAMLNDAAEFAAAELRGDEFTLQGRVMFRALVAMTERGIPVDGVTLADELARRGELEAAGGALGIFEVLEAVPHAEHCRHYVEQLQELHQRDELRRISERLNVRAEDPKQCPSETIAGILNELEGLRAGNVRQNELKTSADALHDADSRTDDKTKHVETGLSELDRQLRGGLRPGQLIVVGGRPGSGKSALMA